MKERVGVVGLGNMGIGIALNLLRAGYPLSVLDVDERKVRELSRRRRVRVAGTPAELAEDTGVILLIVPGPEEVEEVILGEEGLIPRLPRGSVIFDLTTSDPRLSKPLARRLSGKGIGYLDSPMSGGAIGAREGTLTLMVGGERRLLRKYRPMLSAFSKKVFHLGPVGAGHTMKLIHNLLSHITYLAACESLRAGERAGLKLKEMVEVINAGNARSYATEHRFPRYILSGTFRGGSTVYNFRKDVGMGLELERRLKTPHQLSQAAFGYVESAARAGMLKRDYTLLYKYFSRPKNP